MERIDLKYKEAKEYLEKNPELEESLTSAINESIPNKENRFTQEQSLNEYKLLFDKKILISNGDNDYRISFESSLACAALLDYTINLLGKPLPNSPYEAIGFVNDFLEEIRKPRTNYHWYDIVDFGRNFKNFILLEYEQFFLENFDEVLNIYDDNHKFDSPKDNLKFDLDKVIPKYKFTSEQFVILANNLLGKEQERQKGLDIIRAVSSQSHKRANELFEIVKSQNGESLLLSNIIMELSHFDFEKAFDESLKLLHSHNTEVNGIGCLCRLKFSDENQLSKAYQVIKNHESESIAYQRQLPVTYSIFITNDYSTDEIKAGGIDKYRNLIEHEDNVVMNQVVYWLCFIKGFEKEKMEFLYRLLDRGFQINFSEYFGNFSSPSYIFDFVKNIYANFELEANIAPFQRVFDFFYNTHPDEFEKGLSELLSNDFGVIRKAGVDLLAAKHYGTYNVNLLNLSRKCQLIVIDTLLSIPFQIEKTLPIVLQLRNSEFPEVKDALLIHCTQLVFAYEEHIIEVLSEHLNENVDTDAKLLSHVKKIWVDHEKVIKQKQDLLELTPRINQRQLTETYIRSEREHQAELMEQVRKNNSGIMALARNIKILRGCAFKMEANNMITKLGKMEKTTHMDKMYYINPSAYEFAFKNHVLNKNYTNDDEE